MTTKPEIHRIDVGDGIFLSAVEPADKPRYVELLKEREIYEQTLTIPFPYTDEDADWWIRENKKKLEEQGRPVLFAVRDTRGILIGGAGFDNLKIGEDHKTELGYWLGKPYWNQGVMTRVVKRLCALAFDELGLVKITAHIFAFNQGSEKVLRKCGFEQEATLKKHYCKDGSYYDAKIFSLFKG